MFGRYFLFFLLPFEKDVEKCFERNLTDAIRVPPLISEYSIFELQEKLGGTHHNLADGPFKDGSLGNSLRVSFFCIFFFVALSSKFGLI